MISLSRMTDWTLKDKDDLHNIVSKLETRKNIQYALQAKKIYPREYISPIKQRLSMRAGM